MREELISVIIPVYNVGKYIEKCINSIINQKYKNIEIIIVDDGSTDNSGKIIDRLSKKDKRIIVKHKKNGGVSSARNEGLNLVTGKYVCFVDGDDYVMDDYITYMYDLINKKDADISLTCNMFSNFNVNQVKLDNIEYISGREAAMNIMTYNIPIGVYCKLFKTSFLKENNIRFIEDIYIGEGFNFNVDAFQMAKNVNVGQRKIYYYRRDNETSATTKFSYDKWINGLKAIDIMYDRKKYNDKSYISSWTFAKWRTNVDIYCLLVTSKSEKKYHEFYKQVKKIGKKYWMYAFITNSSKKEKIRAILFFINAKTLPFLVLRRKKKYLKGGQENGEN